MAKKQTQKNKKLQGRVLKRRNKYDLAFADVAARLKELGASKEQIAYLFGISKSTFYKWQKDHPEFKEAMNNARDVVIAKLIGHAIQSACGFEYEEEREEYKPDENGTLRLEKVVKFKNRKPPDAKLLVTLLCNMDKENWKSEHRIEVDHKNRGPTIKIDGKLASEQISKLAGKLIDRKVVDAEVLEDNDTKRLLPDNSDESEG